MIRLAAAYSPRPLARKRNSAAETEAAWIRLVAAYSSSTNALHVFSSDLEVL